MALSILEQHVTFVGDGDLYIAFYDKKEDAEATGFQVQTGWVILDDNNHPAEDSQDMYFDYSQAIEDLLTLESKLSHG